MGFKLIGFCLVAVVALASIGLSTPSRSDLVVIGDSEYRIPRTFEYSASDGTMFLQISYPEFGVLTRDSVGWNAHVNILVRERGDEPIAGLWDRLYGANHIRSTTLFRIVSTDKSVEGWTYFHIASGDLVRLPDQDMSIMPDGFIVCGKPPEPPFKYNACEYLFDQGTERWKITFGSQYVDDYKNIRTRSVALMKGFKIK